jgi:diguanylate cyclase (GGDEF)-like protein
VALLLLVQGVAGFFVLRSNERIARETIGLALAQGERVFQQLFAQNQSRLQEGAAILSADFAFRQAIATDDIATILSVFRNHGARIGAGAMMLVSLDNVVRADTQEPERVGKPFAFPQLVQRAASGDKASSIALIDRHLYQLVVVPVLAPEPIAWVGLAFEVDDALANQLRELTGLEVTILTRAGDGPWRVHASTLAPTLRAALPLALARAPENAMELILEEETYETRLAPLPADPAIRVVAVLQRPLSEGLRPFHEISFVFFLLSMAAIVALIIGSLVIARGITRPVERLVQAAGRVQAGDYSRHVDVAERKDEVGQLAESFNHMIDGIVSREREILRLAYEDGLTTLPNRAMFIRQLEQAVRTARRAGAKIGVLLLDMDRFKTINDTLGHPVGDQALREVGFRVRGALRDSDIVARLGGDEFAVLLATGGEETIVAEKMLKTLETPIAIETHTMDIAASIGIARFPEHGDDANALLRAADVAMYAAKRGQLGFAVYDPGIDERRQEYLTLLGELRRAVEADQLVLHYQPKVSLQDNRVTSVEVLVRWHHPGRGFVPPNQFIPFAEQTGYIGAITQWVLTHAIAQVSRWRRAGLALPICVNISARDLRQGEALVQTITRQLQENDVPAGMLCLEITESALMDDPRGSQATLKKLRELGVATSIDDYGTGYSSLAYIKQLAVNEIKIDRAFVSGMEADRRNAAIVRSTIELGHNLGLSVVAEGVETEHEREQLRRFGCDLGQGFHFARPMPAEALEAWLAAGAPRERPTEAAYSPR